MASERSPASARSPSSAPKESPPPSNRLWKMAFDWRRAVADGGQTIRRVGLIVHLGREGAIASARSLVSWARERGIATVSLESEEIGADECRDDRSFHLEIDLVISVGGDG